MATGQSAPKDKFSVATCSLEMSGHGKDKKKLTRKRDLLLAFTMVFLPMMAIPLILLAFLLYTHKHPILDTVGSVELPVNYHKSKGSYYTFFSVGVITLVGSWATNAAQFIMAPVMLLFSFLIARGYREDSQSRDIDPNAMTIAEIRSEAEIRGHHLDEVAKGISKAAWKDVWEGVKFLAARADKGSGSRALQIATVGGMVSALFT
jgi:hypothetical protein